VGSVVSASTREFLRRSHTTIPSYSVASANERSALHGNLRNCASERCPLFRARL
jgi:hypothetical protein